LEKRPIVGFLFEKEMQYLIVGSFFGEETNFCGTVLQKRPDDTTCVYACVCAYVCVCVCECDDDVCVYDWIP